MFSRLTKFALVSLLLPLAVSAQDTAADWEVVLYDGTQIQFMGPQGVTHTLPVPTGAQNLENFSGYNFVRISPDHRYLVFAQPVGAAEGQAPQVELRVADLEAQTCCEIVAPPFEGSADTIILGPTSPDGAQIAVLFARAYSEDAASSVATVNLASHAVTAQIDPSEIDGGSVGVGFGQWTDEGILMFPTCLACGGVIDGLYSRWNPTNGELTNDVEFFTNLGDELAATGEILVATQNPDYPISTEEGMMPPSNVVEYYAEGDPENAQIVYHNPDDLSLSIPNWVANGQAYLLHNWGEAAGTLVFRDAREVSVEFPEQSHILVGTPDGWLMQSDSDKNVYFYQINADGSGMSVFSLGEFPSGVAVLREPALGSPDLQDIVPLGVQ